MTAATKRLAREPTKEMWAAAESNMAALDEQGQFPDFFDTWRVMWDACQEAETPAYAREAVIEEALEIIQQLEVISYDDNECWLHLRPDGKRKHGFVSIHMTEKPMVKAYKAWFERIKKWRVLKNRSTP